MSNKWEFFSLVDAQITASQVIDLLENVENQGYDPRFLKASSTHVIIYGRKKDIPYIGQQPSLFEPEEVIELTPEEIPAPFTEGGTTPD